jgi:SsrA-binding protein
MSIKIIATNRKAFHEYSIEDTVEAGVVLTGTEVKSARAGKVNLTDGWVEITEDGEAVLNAVHIAKYSHGSYMNHEEQRPRKLLLHRREIGKLTKKIEEKGFTLIPLKAYFLGQFIKLELGLAKGKKLHDKRDSAKTAEANRAMARAMRAR